MENFNSSQITNGDQNQALLQIINSDNPTQLTPFLFDLLSGIPFPIKGSKDKLIQIQQFVQFIERAGWIEHTADWDLGMVYTLNDGFKIDTGNGYWVFDIKGDEIEVEYYDEDEEEDDMGIMLIKISEIKEMKFYR